MKPSNNAVNFIMKWEGFKPNAYKCPADVPTIGFGSTRYLNGSRVKIGDTISKEDAFKLLVLEINIKAAAIGDTGVKTQNQFDAIVSFVYNVGVGAWNKSTLRKKIMIDPFDTSIRNEFMKWVNGGGKQLTGLVKRRKEEANLYFTL